LSRKKNKQRHRGSLVVAAEQKGKKEPVEGTPVHFKKLLEGPCPNHAYPIKHMYKEFSLIERFLSGGSKRGIRRRSLTPRRTTSRRRRAPF
jgi:hypothetical protein